MVDRNNEQILNELFGKKKSYSETMKEKQAQYTPVKKTDDIKSFFNGNPDNGIVVSDMDAVKKKVVSALGMAMGNNTIRSMAQKAIKNFPIIISDDLAPETAVMVKTMAEEQYASNIDLLVSNQIINISDYETSNDENGNIAIQALSRLNGTDFGTGRIARKAQTGSLSIDDIMVNNAPWQLMRTNENYTSGNSILDTLMENAIIVDSKDEKKAAAALYEEMLVEAHTAPLYGTLPKATSSKGKITDDDIRGAVSVELKKDLEYGDLFVDILTKRIYQRNVEGYWLATDYKDPRDEAPEKRLSGLVSGLVDRDRVDMYNKYGIKYAKNDLGNYEKAYDKLLTPSILAREDDFNLVMDKSIGAILSGDTARNPREKEIADYVRDRFEKATFLLTGRRIAGHEYISYITIRLGLPLADAVKKEILQKFMATDVVFNGVTEDDELIKQLRNNVDKNQRYVLGSLTPKMVSLTGKDVAIILGSSIGTGATTAGIMGTTLAAAGTIGVTAMVLLPAVAAVGAAGLAAHIIKIIKTKKAAENDQGQLTTSTNPSIYGWERVEMLIDQMDTERADLIKHKDELNGTGKFYERQKYIFNDFAKKMDNILSRVTVNENITDLRPYMGCVSEEFIENNLKFNQELSESLMEDEDFMREYDVLEEAAKYIINTKKPGDIIVKQTKYDAKAAASMIPTFGTKDVVAYGSVEYDKRDIKDRKFNEPLILTIKFKERYSDGKYTDNELTAVIGILGVITRVPSDEMAYILKSNAEGKTLRDFFKGDESNDSKDLIGNVIKNFMSSKVSEKLPTSGKVWANLEKVTALAVANKLAGNNNGNISNAHLIFSQREIDAVKNELGIDYLKNAKLTAQLMKKYAAYMVAVCNDTMQYIYTYTDPDAISWDDAPYTAYMSKSNSDQLLSAFTQYNRNRL